MHTYCHIVGHFLCVVGLFFSQFFLVLRTSSGLEISFCLIVIHPWLLGSISIYLDIIDAML